MFMKTRQGIIIQEQKNPYVKINQCLHCYFPYFFFNQMNFKDIGQQTVWPEGSQNTTEKPIIALRKMLCNFCAQSK